MKVKINVGDVARVTRQLQDLAGRKRGQAEPECVCKMPYVVNRKCTACGRPAAPEPFVISVKPFDAIGIDHIVLAAARGAICDKCREGAARFVRCGMCRKIHQRCGAHAEHLIQDRDECCRGTTST